MREGLGEGRLALGQRPQRRRVAEERLQRRVGDDDGARRARGHVEDLGAPRRREVREHVADGAVRRFYFQSHDGLEQDRLRPLQRVGQRERSRIAELARAEVERADGGVGGDGEIVYRFIKVL